MTRFDPGRRPATAAGAAGAAATFDAIDTPAGPVSFACDGEAVREVRLGDGRRDGATRTALHRETARQLQAYFGGKLEAFDLPFDLDEPPFRTAVLEAVAAIPYGATLSYGQVAAAVGCPQGFRAVGQAVGANPLPLLIPCHRVLAANRRLGGFGGGLDWKRFLLRLENASWRA